MNTAPLLEDVAWKHGYAAGLNAYQAKSEPARSAPVAGEREALACGHPASLMLKSAETGEPLYCKLCDAQSGRRDAEMMEAELRDNLAREKDVAWKHGYAAGLNAYQAKSEPARSAQEQYDESMAGGLYDGMTPLDRLRFFCSIAMRGQDWLDVAPFFDAVIGPPTTNPKEQP